MKNQKLINFVSWHAYASGIWLFIILNLIESIKVRKIVKIRYGMLRGLVLYLQIFHANTEFMESEPESDLFIAIARVIHSITQARNTGSCRWPLCARWPVLPSLTRRSFGQICNQVNNPGTCMGKAKRGWSSDGMESKANIPDWCLSNLIKVLVRCCTMKWRLNPAHRPRLR